MLILSPLLHFTHLAVLPGPFGVTVTFYHYFTWFVFEFVDFLSCVHI